jgi:cupin superfamily acireductone dioxygenase involved in methionine salvage
MPGNWRRWTLQQNFLIKIKSYIVAGSGVFDIRSKEDVDAWIRIEVVAGDYIRIPANRYHRFMLTPEVFITAIRLFKDVSGWEPTYRE